DADDGVHEDPGADHPLTQADDLAEEDDQERHGHAASGEEDEVGRSKEPERARKALQRASDPFHRSLVHALPHLIGDTTGGPYHARSGATSPSSAAEYSTPSFPRHGKQNVHRWHDSGGRSGRKGEIGRSISLPRWALPHGGFPVPTVCGMAGSAPGTRRGREQPMSDQPPNRPDAEQHQEARERS